MRMKWISLMGSVNEMVTCDGIRTRCTTPVVPKLEFLSCTVLSIGIHSRWMEGLSRLSFVEQRLKQSWTVRVPTSYHNTAGHRSYRVLIKLLHINEGFTPICIFAFISCSVSAPTY